MDEISSMEIVFGVETALSAGLTSDQACQRRGQIAVRLTQLRSEIAMLKETDERLKNFLVTGSPDIAAVPLDLHDSI